jgi:hypothetical protein
MRLFVNHHACWRCDGKHRLTSQAAQPLSACIAFLEAQWSQKTVWLRLDQSVAPDMACVPLSVFVFCSCRFIDAAKAAAATRPSSPDQQCIAALLSTPPLLLACDASCLDFWRASAASTARAAACPPLEVVHAHNAARPTHSASSWWPGPPLVASSSPAAGCRRGIEDVVQFAQKQEQQRREKLEASRADGADGNDHAGVCGCCPATQ